MATRDVTKKASGKTAKAPKTKRAPKGEKTFDRDVEEAILVKKYPNQTIVKGSLRDAGELPEFGQKRTVEIVCQGDKKTKRRIATSDLHQVKYSEKWMHDVRLQRRSELRGTKPKSGGKKAGKAKAKGKSGKTRAPRTPKVSKPETHGAPSAAEPATAGAAQ